MGRAVDSWICSFDPIHYGHLAIAELVPTLLFISDPADKNVFGFLITKSLREIFLQQNYRLHGHAETTGNVGILSIALWAHIMH